jgi:FtsH-binding integral membrane protein
MMKKLLIGAALAAMTIELAMIPTMFGPDDFWPAAVVFAALFALGAWWADRSNRWGPRALLCVLFAVELLGLPAYARSNLADWVLQSAIGLASVIGLVAGIGLSFSSRRDRSDVMA